jgi:hypothetical protein
MSARSLARKLAAYLTLASTALALLSAAQAATAPKHVLVIYSHNRLVPGNVLVDQGLSAELLHDSERPLRMHFEFLDEPEFGGDPYESAMVAYLRLAGRLEVLVTCVRLELVTISLLQSLGEMTARSRQA